MKKHKWTPEIITVLWCIVFTCIYKSPILGICLGILFGMRFGLFGTEDEGKEK